MPLHGKGIVIDMKKTICLLLSALLLLACVGCNNKKDAEPELPKPANAPEVLAKWDEYDILASVPRYLGSGFFDNVYVGQEGMTVVSYVAVPAEEFESYAMAMGNYGFVLEDDSSIWVTQGITGVPIFKKGSLKLTLVWNMNGTLDIGVSRIAD